MATSAVSPRVNVDDGLLRVEFDGRIVEYEFGELDELSPAYATSIHKSQGSEYPAVVIPLAMQHFMLLERNLLYTAVTRGQEAGHHYRPGQGPSHGG